MIETYAFGQMVIDGQTYTSDLIIFPSRIQSSWWRQAGHRLCLADLQNVFQEEPEAVVVGTGFYGLMKVEKEVKEMARAKNISLIIEKTKEAVQSFNRIASQKKTIGAFHLTC